MACLQERSQRAPGTSPGRLQGLGDAEAHYYKGPVRSTRSESKYHRKLPSRAGEGDGVRALLVCDELLTAPLVICNSSITRT